MTTQCFKPAWYRAGRRFASWCRSVNRGKRGPLTALVVNQRTLADTFLGLGRFVIGHALALDRSSRERRPAENAVVGLVRSWTNR